MIVGRDFPDLFENDNFTSRRTTGHNLFNPEAFITGQELASGLTFANSQRNWTSQGMYEAACRGYLSLEDILRYAPRVKTRATVAHISLLAA